jgi:hypothetical protein
MNNDELAVNTEDAGAGPAETKSRLTPMDSRPVTEVRLIVAGTDGEIYYTWGGLNPDLASVLAKQAMLPDWPVDKQEAKFMALGRDLYRVPRAYFLSVVGTFCTSDYATVAAIGSSIPETSVLTIEVVR